MVEAGLGAGLKTGLAAAAGRIHLVVAAVAAVAAGNPCPVAGTGYTYSVVQISNFASLIDSSSSCFSTCVSPIDLYGFLMLFFFQYQLLPLTRKKYRRRVM